METKYKPSDKSASYKGPVQHGSGWRSGYAEFSICVNLVKGILWDKIQTWYIPDASKWSSCTGIICSNSRFFSKIAFPLSTKITSAIGVLMLCLYMDWWVVCFTLGGNRILQTSESFQRNRWIEHNLHMRQLMLNRLDSCEFCHKPCRIRNALRAHKHHEHSTMQNKNSTFFIISLNSNELYFLFHLVG